MIEKDIGAQMQRCFEKEVLTHNNFRMVALLSASLVIKECESWQPNGDHTNYPSNGTVLAHLNRNVTWSLHGFINALQSHVQIIYAYQVAAIKSQKHHTFMICPDIDEAILLAKSLNVYQDWKTGIINREKAIHGPEWGDATGFTQSKWNENNKEFLDLYKKKEEQNMKEFEIIQDIDKKHPILNEVCPVCKKNFTIGDRLVLVTIQQPKIQGKYISAMALPIHTDCYLLKIKNVNNIKA